MDIQAQHRLLEQLERMTPVERLEVVALVREACCMSCGGDARPNGRICQCWNDE